jgi:hypothetical protein
MGPVASFKKVGVMASVVNKLPKTRWGKILRGTMKKIANGEHYKIAPTIEDPAVFDCLAPEIVKLMNKSDKEQGSSLAGGAMFLLHTYTPQNENRLYSFLLLDSRDKE